VKRRLKFLFLITILLLAVPVLADDGDMLRRNVSKTPSLLTEHAALTMLELYVPAQSSDGELLSETDEGGIEYDDAEENLVETRGYAKPLISFFQDGHVVEVEGTGFVGHGKRDAWAAVSLDDGETWKRTNLSKSGNLSSFTIGKGSNKVPYPGDVVRLFQADDGNKAMLVWASRYCRGGSPTYALEQEELDFLETIPELDGFVGDSAGDCQAIDQEDEDFTFDDQLCPYFEDYWGVAGSQGSSDFADEGYPEVGEVPYSCMWAARGTLETVDEEGKYDPAGERYGMVWRKAERLTSGRRDAYRMEAACIDAAGCVVTWQEDPDGLRPGEGEGPGEGWSGAIAHHQTDTWYSFLSWDNFDLVDDGEDGFLSDPLTLEELFNSEAGIDGVPKVGIPLSIPVRLTDNAMCVAESEEQADDPYCYIDFDGSGAPDFCAETVTVEIEPPEGETQTIDMCITENGRLMRGNTASTRPRTNLRGYDTDDDGILDRAWVITAYEENKGLGEEEYDAGLIDPGDDEEMTKVDMGKNIWYHTFDMFEPELVSQGMILNQPAIYPEEFEAIGSLVEDSLLGYKFMTIEPDPIYETQAGLESTLYQSEIARRFSLISQEADEIGESGTVAFAMWKQGIIRRGGPADVMARRFVIPDDFDAAVDNPFAYENMVCDAESDGTSDAIFTDGSNPRYVKGLCPAPAVALSNTTIVASDGSVPECVDEESCQDAFPWDDYFADLDMSDSEGLAKITEWRWCEDGASFDIAGDDATAFTCEDSDIDDNSWDNPYDVAKGHRGFIEGDFIMMLYAWSPNWMANTVGHDNYNLYIRRSFDGGVTWTTTPASYLHTDGEAYSGSGATSCEWMGETGTETEFPVCTTYGAGDFEQARNVSQLVGIQETILDPRYSPTRSSITEDSIPDGFEMPAEEWVEEDASRDPTRFFIVYETGDNTTVEAGEAEPLDLFYSRAVDWGDNYMVLAEEVDLCYPSDPTNFEKEDNPVDDRLVDSGFCNEFDWLEGDHRSQSGEGSVTAGPEGDFFYALWNQDDLDEHEHVIASDAWFRRVWFLEEYIPPIDDSGGGPGNLPSNPDISTDGTLVSLDWEAADGATGYNIYRGTTPYFDAVTLYDTTAELSWTDPDPNAIGDPGINYFYVVKPFNDGSEAEGIYRNGVFDFGLE